MEIDKKQIDAWKAQYGDVFKIEAADKECYLRRPNRKELSYASVAGSTDPLKYNEILLKACWLDGDKEIQTNDGLFLSVSQHLSSLIEITESKLVKL